MLINPYSFGSGSSTSLPAVTSAVLDQFGIETLKQRPSHAILTQVGIETLSQRPGSARVSSIVFEVLDKAVRAKVSQLAVETLRRVTPAGSINRRVTSAVMEVLEYTCASHYGAGSTDDGLTNSGVNIGIGGSYYYGGGSGYHAFDVQPCTLQDAIATCVAKANEFFAHLGVTGSNGRLDVAAGGPSYKAGNHSIMWTDTTGGREIGEWFWDGVDRNTSGAECGPQAQVSSSVMEVLITSASLSAVAAGAQVKQFVIEALVPTKQDNVHGGVS